MGLLVSTEIKTGTKRTATTSHPTQPHDHLVSRSGIMTSRQPVSSNQFNDTYCLTVASSGSNHITPTINPEKTIIRIDWKNVSFRSHKIVLSRSMNRTAQISSSAILAASATA